MEKKEKCIRSETIYQGKILTLKKDTVLLPDQTEATREVVRHVYGACILAIDENRNVLLEEQYRYPYDETVLELPAGKSEPGETPEKTAVREFEEETGYKAKSMTLLGEFYPSCGYTDEIIYLFLADGLIKG